MFVNDIKQRVALPGCLETTGAAGNLKFTGIVLTLTMEQFWQKINLFGVPSVSGCFKLRSHPFQLRSLFYLLSLALLIIINCIY